MKPKSNSVILVEVATEEDYLAARGCGMSGLGEFSLHRYPRRLSGSAQKAATRVLVQGMENWQSRRDQLRNEYRERVAKGEVRQPTRMEKLTRIASGDPENSAVQAAKRILQNIQGQ